MKTTPSRFGKITFPATNQQIENCWLRLEDNNKPYLEVPYNSFQNDNWDIITGSFNGLDKVTFYKCDLGVERGGRGGYYRRIFFSFMFENEKFNRKEDLFFNKITFNSGALENWIIDNSVCLDIEYSKSTKQLTIPNKKTLHKVQTKIGTIAISRGFDSLIGSGDAKLVRKSAIAIEFKESKHFDEISRFLVEIKRLIIFLTHENPDIERYSLPLEGVSRPIILKYNSRFTTMSGFSEGIKLKYLDIKPHLENIIKNWIEKEKLFQVIELIQEKYMNTTLSFQNYFLNCCVAMESFHIRFAQKDISQEAKEAIEKRKGERCLIANLISDEDLKREFNSRTTDWKKPTFKEKIQCFESSIDFIKADNFKDSTEEFIRKVVNTRNKIAHEGEYLKYLTELELLLFGKVLEFVVKIEILKTLGIEDEKLLEKFQTDARHSVRILAEMNGYS